MTIFLPLSGQISRWSGGGLGNDGAVLENLSTVGVRSVSSYVRHGVDSPEDSSFWTNDNIMGGENSWFYSTLEQMTISPTGTIEFKARGDVAFFNDFTIQNLILWARKEVNPSISNDVIVASGLGSVSFFDSTITNKTVNMQIVEANRTTFESALPFYPTLSGQISWGINLASSGDYRIREININASGQIPATPSSNNEITLFISGYSNASGNIPLYIASIGNSSGNIPLYISGFGNSSGNIPLYTFGISSGVNNLTLFISGAFFASSGLDLYLLSIGNSSGNIPLYIPGALFASSGLDLYTISSMNHSGNMPLFIKSKIGVPSSGQTTLFTWSSENSGLYKTLELVLFNQSQFSPQQVIPFVLQGPGSIAFSGNMNLFLQNNVPNVVSGIDLFIANYWSLNSGNIPLYMRGPFGTEGAVPLSGTMPLFIARSSDGVAIGLDLMIKNYDVGSGNVPFYVFGANIQNSSIPMYIGGFSTVNNSDLSTLFISGW